MSYAEEITRLNNKYKDLAEKLKEDLGLESVFIDIMTQNPYSEVQIPEAMIGMPVIKSRKKIGGRSAVACTPVQEFYIKDKHYNIIHELIKETFEELE